MKTIKRIELFGNYSGKRKIIIDACQFMENEIEVMAIREGNVLVEDTELDCITVQTEAEALKTFDSLINKYAESLQKALYNAKMVEGGKYTLVYLNDFGFPVAQRITYHEMQLCTYVQYSDCVRLVFTPYRKRKMYAKTFYNTSLMIFEGWQDLKEEDIKNTISDNGKVKTTISKYGSFDAQYIDDLEKVFKNPVVIYKDYKQGVNGKMYA